MENARWQKVQSLFHEATELPAADQRNFLETRCKDDEELAKEVLVLLREDALGESLLEGNVAEVAQEIFDGSSAEAVQFKTFGPYRNHIARSAKEEWGLSTLPNARTLAVRWP